MASAFSHPAVPLALVITLGHKITFRLFVFAALVSAAPDLDFLGHQLGVPYSSPWGHRGFTHSLFFAFIFALCVIPFSKVFKCSRAAVFITIFFSLASHGIVDGLTNGGLGVAYFWPFNNERYFLSWRVIEVAPLSISRFFTERGIEIIKSEFYYLWLPCLLSAGLLRLFLSRLSPRSKNSLLP